MMWILARDLLKNEDCNISVCYKGERGDFQNVMYYLVVETENGEYRKQMSFTLAQAIVREWWEG